MTAGQEPADPLDLPAAEGASPPPAAPAAGPPAAAPPATRIPDPAARLRGLQLASILLVVGGLGAVLAVVAASPWLRDQAAPRPSDEAAAAVLAGVVAAGMAVLLGLAANVARSLVVREALPPERYRGPSLLVLLLLAALAANAASAAAIGDLARILEGESPSPRGALILLTATQVALVGTAALYVFAPRALAGLRLFPGRRPLRSIGLGLLLAVPAWIGAQVIATIVVRILALVGIEPEPGVTQAALETVDPVILVVALVVVAPVAEELFFRGVVLNAWLREYGARRALWGSAVLFGLIHLDPFLVLPIIGLGFVLGVLYRRTGSLPASIALHAGFNGISVALTLLVRYGVLDIPLP